MRIRGLGLRAPSEYEARVRDFSSTVARENCVVRPRETSDQAFKVGLAVRLLCLSQIPEAANVQPTEPEPWTVKEYLDRHDPQRMADLLACSLESLVQAPWA